MKAINELERYKLSFANNSDNYKLYHSYYRMCDCVEVVRGWNLASTKNSIRTIQIEPKVFMVVINGKIAVDCRIVVDGEKFNLYEMNLKSYSEYERGAVNYL